LFAEPAIATTFVAEIFSYADPETVTYLLPLITGSESSAKTFLSLCDAARSLPPPSAAGAGATGTPPRPVGTKREAPSSASSGAGASGAASFSSHVVLPWSSDYYNIPPPPLIKASGEPWKPVEAIPIETDFNPHSNTGRKLDWKLKCGLTSKSRPKCPFMIKDKTSEALTQCAAPLSFVKTKGDASMHTLYTADAKCYGDYFGCPEHGFLYYIKDWFIVGTFSCFFPLYFT